MYADDNNLFLVFRKIEMEARRKAEEEERRKQEEEDKKAAALLQVSFLKHCYILIIKLNVAETCTLFGNILYFHTLKLIAAERWRW